MTNGGFIQLIAIIIIFIIILSLLGVSFTSVFNNRLLKENLAFVWEWSGFIWNNYLKAPAEFVWNLFTRYIWGPFTEVIKSNFKERTVPVQTESSLVK